MSMFCGVEYDNILVYCDLEGVLIDNWEEFNFASQQNEEIIEICEYSTAMPEIFSNAVDNAKDFLKLRKALPDLCKNSGVNFVMPTLCVEQRACNAGMSLWEYKALGKAKCFEMYVKDIHNDFDGKTLCILLDDNVASHYRELSENCWLLFVNVQMGE